MEEEEMSHSASGNVLIVDDESNALKVLSTILSEDGFKVIECQSADKALQELPRMDLDAVITDVRMPGMDGMQLFEGLRAKYPKVPVIFLTAYGDVESAVYAMTRGAFDYIIKPPDFGRLKRIVAKAIGQRRLERAVESTSDRFIENGGCCPIIGNSPKIVELLETIEAVKDSASSILISGETGTGKELIARNLHNRSQRKDRPFVAVNCAAVPRGLIESEFFGSEKGAFTGSMGRRIGKFEEASGGTVLLDEIAELELPLQAKLLRVLQEREIERLGSNKRIKVDFRLISSSNRDLAQEVAKGTFREDLFYRINVLEISMPPLRERMSDVPLLVSQFIHEFCKRENKALSVSDEVMQALQNHTWPGNVRQLQNVVERAVVLARGTSITLNELPSELRPLKTPARWPDKLVPLRELEVRAIKDAILACNGNKSKAAKMLGISRKAFYSRLKG
jgi:two-component system response regulator HydG